MSANRIPNSVSNSYQTIVVLLAVCLLGVAVATVPIASADAVEDGVSTEESSATVESAEDTTLTSATAIQSSDVVATFKATNTGDGFISFDENNIDDARAEGLSFSEGDIIIEGEIYENGTWQSTDTSFKTLNTADDGSGFDAKPRAINGLSGEFDPETGRMTADGTLQIELLLTGDTFQFDLAMITETSNGAASSDGLSGEFNAGLDEQGFVNLVDNEYTVPEQTGNDILDQQLGLPIEDPGLSWFDLHLNVDASRVVPDTGSLTGTVTNDNGEPIEGATVNVRDAAAETTTAADGSYRFEKLTAGTYDVRVSADNYQTNEGTVEIVGGEQSRQDVTLQPTPANFDLSLEGSVVTAGETLEVVGTVTNTGGQTATETATLSIGTLASTEQSITVAPGESVQITETVETTKSDVGGYTAELAVNDKRATTEAVVRSPFDQKQPIATFTAENAGEGLISFSSTLTEAVVEGSYFPADEIIIEGEIYDDGTWQSTNIEIPQIQTSADKVEVNVDVPGGITGTIDRDAGTMTANGEFSVSVVGRDASFQFVLEATTGESGLISGEANFDEDPAEITLMENEFTVDQTTGDEVVDTGLELPASEPGENWFSLVLDMSIDGDPTGTVAGTVVDQNGDPVEGATVAVAGTETTTGTDGSYEFSDLNVGSYDLQVTAAGADGQTTTVTVSAGERISQEIQLTRSGSATGTVLDQNGDPISGATVSAGGQSVQTDAQGQYSIDGLAVGTQTLTVTTPDGAKRTAEIEITAGEQTERTIEFDLTGSVAGVVETNAGQPIPGVTVTVEGTNIETTTAQDGSFSLEGVSAGTQTLVVDPEGVDAQSVTVEITAGQQAKQDITLDLSATLAGTVETVVGDPFEGATVQLVNADDQVIDEVTTDNTGAYEFDTVPAGEYALTADGGDSGRARKTVTIAPGETTEQTLQLGLPDIEVSIEDLQTTEGQTATVTGVIENSGAARDFETARLAVKGVAATEQDVEVVPGEATTVELKLTPGAGEYPVRFTVGDESAEATLAVISTGDVVANFRAEAVGTSYVSFDHETKADAEADGTPFPDANEASGDGVLWIEGQIFEDGTWRATGQNLPNLQKSGLDIAVDNLSRMTGKIDPESGYMSVDTGFRTTVISDNDPSFTFEIAADSEQSNALSGSAEFEQDTLKLDDGESYSGSVSLVDNEFVVKEKTQSPLINSQLGLPSTTAGNNWFKLNLDLVIQEGEAAGGSVEGRVTDSDGESIEGATVTAGGAETTTGSDGTYSLSDVRAGESTLTVDATDYEETTTDVDVQEDGVVEQDITLQPGEPEYAFAVTADDVTAGETLTVDGAVANVGTATGRTNVRITVSELSTKSEDIELAPQTDTTITDDVDTTGADPGEYTVIIQVGSETKTTEITIEEPKDHDSDETDTGETATFRATSTSGFISFDETNIDDARAEGISFPDGSDGNTPILIEGDISEDGTWESTNIQFPTLNTAEDGSGFDAQATFPDGLSGTFNPETGRMTAEGTLEIELALTGDSFQFDIALTTATSNGAASSDGLDGSFQPGDPTRVTLVDNQYTVDTTTDSGVLNQQLGLPLSEPGQAWLKLGLEMDITAGSESAKTGEVSGTVETADGEPIAGATVAVEGERRRTTTDNDGSYELSGVPAGAQTLTVAADGYKQTTAAVEIEAGGTAERDLSLSGLAPNFEASVDAPETTAGELTTVTSTVTNTGGPGSEEITITVGDQSTTETVELGSGESTTVEFEFQSEQAGEYSTAVSIGEREAAASNVVVAERESADNSGGTDGGSDGGFIATSRGGFTSFTESSESAARENTGVTYPAAEEGTPIEIGATINGNTWTASQENISFPTLTTEDGIEVSVRAPNGLSGEIDRESNTMTATGELEVEVGDGNTFSFELDATTVESGALTGEAALDGDAATVTLIDNQFTIPEKTDDPLINQQLGLPAETPGENWFELKLGLEFVNGGAVDDAGGNSSQQETTEDDDTEGSAFTTLGLVGGVAGLGFAGLFVLLVLARRLINFLDPDPEM